MAQRLKQLLKGCAIGLAVLVGAFILLAVILAVCGTDSNGVPVDPAPTPDSRAVAPDSTPPPTRVQPTPTMTPIPTPTRVPPTPTPFPLVDAVEVYREYERNETRANRMYTGQWFTVSLPHITRIGDDGKVLRDMDEFGLSYIEMVFKNESDVIPLNPGDSVTAVCKVSHGGPDILGIGYKLRLDDCRLP